MMDLGVIDSAIKQGIFPAILVVIYLIIIKVIDTKKEKTQIKINDTLINSITNISNFLSDTTKNVIEKNKEKCKAAIESSLKGASAKLINFVASTIINNHIDLNKDIVLANIHNIINTEFYTVFSILSLYNINGIKVSSLLKKEWMNEIEKDMIDIIYNSKLKNEEKILSFINKITIKFQSYCTYIINNVIK